MYAKIAAEFYFPTFSRYETLTEKKHDHVETLATNFPEGDIKEPHSRWCVQLHAPVLFYNILPMLNWNNWKYIS